MQNSAPRLQESASCLALPKLEKFAGGWFPSGEISQHSQRTLGNRRMVIRNLSWFLRRREFTKAV
ncbi:MAG TPA: hypothetical protein VKZ53_24090 [Candidatus Angelobacter sp.]|nr:hypothetical protein [Candidatus Angelobacter sp.]